MANDDKPKKNYTNRQEMNSDYLVVGIDWSREVLRGRIEERANKFFTQENIEYFKIYFKYFILYQTW